MKKMKDLKTEIWKPVKGYEGLYEVSSLGNVRSLDRYVMLGNHGNQYCLLKGKPIKAFLDSKGYLMADLCKNGQRKLHLVHRLVAEAFISNPNNLPCIDHINTIKTDNRVENLRWCSYKENSNNPLTIEHIISRKNKPVYYIDKQGKKIIFKSISEAARKIGCSPSAITIALKENRPACGIQFYFETEKTTAN